jgi:hypothetical protein
MATAKDFNQTAANTRAEVEELRASYEPSSFALEVGLRVAKRIASQMASGYALQNSRFDRARFLAACGFEG